MGLIGPAPRVALSEKQNAPFSRRERDHPRLDQQMHVIGHQHIGIASKAIAPAVAFKAFEIGFIIGVVMKEGGPAVATGDHMIEAARELDPWFPYHGPTLGLSHE